MTEGPLAAFSAIAISSVLGGGSAIATIGGFDRDDRFVLAVLTTDRDAPFLFIDSDDPEMGAAAHFACGGEPLWSDHAMALYGS